MDVYLLEALANQKALCERNVKNENERLIKDLGCSSVVQGLPGTHEALASISSTANRQLSLQCYL